MNKPDAASKGFHVVRGGAAGVDGGPLAGAVVAIGNFDGVHRGHRALIAEARKQAQASAAPLAVLSFEPHPQEFFKPSPDCFRLTPLRTKARLLAELGVDVLFALPFDADMARRAPQDFVEIVRAWPSVEEASVGPDVSLPDAR